MNIEIIPIAFKKLQKRKIRQEWVIDAVKNSEQVLEGYGITGRTLLEKGGRQ